MATTQHGRATSPSLAQAATASTATQAQSLASSSQSNLSSPPDTLASSPARRSQRKSTRQATSTSKLAASPLHLSRAFSTLCLASTLASQVFPIQGAKALAIPKDSRYGAQGAQATSIPAGIARRRSQDGRRQQVRQYGERNLGVKEREQPGEELAAPLKVGKFTIDEGRPPPMVNTASEATTTSSSKSSSSSSSSMHSTSSSSAAAATSSSSHLSPPINGSASSPPSGRWGQSASYLSNEQTILFVGGQVSNGSQVALTNDVFALNVSSLATNSTSGPTNPWQQLSATGLPPHAFAASATRTVNGTDQVWLIGGDTQSCEAAPAWTWTASASANLSNTSWASVNFSSQASTSRKASAQAIEVSVFSNGAATNATSLLLLGGRDVSRDCASSFAHSTSTSVHSKRHYNATDISADLWTLPALSAASTSSNSSSKNASAFLTSMTAPRLSNVSVILGNGDFSMVDYSVATLPSSTNSTGNATTLYLGGLTPSGSYASLSQFWTYSPSSNTWSQRNATGDIPQGRRGQTSTLLKDGRVAMIGGLLENGTYTDHVYLLNVSSSPAVWEKVKYAAGNVSVAAPARAYHSTVRVGEVLVVAFGASKPSNETGNSSIKARAETDSSASSLFYLDTASSGGWRWSDSIEGVLAARGVQYAESSPSQTSSDADVTAAQAQGTASASAPASAAATPAASPAPASGSAATPSAVAPSQSISASVPADKVANAASPATATSEGDASVTSAFPDQPSSSSAAEAESATDGSATPSSSDAATPSSNAASTTPTNSSSSSNANASSATKSGAVAGGIIGAVALAAGLSGFWAYKHRMEAQKRGYQDGGDDENKYSYSDKSHDEGLTAIPAAAWYARRGRRSAVKDSQEKMGVPFTQGRIDPFMERNSISVPEELLAPRTLRDSLAATASPAQRFPSIVKGGVEASAEINKRQAAKEAVAASAAAIVARQQQQQRGQQQQIKRPPPAVISGAAAAASATAAAAASRSANPAPAPTSAPLRTRAVPQDQRYLSLDYTPSMQGSPCWATKAGSPLPSDADISDGEASHLSYPCLAAMQSRHRGSNAETTDTDGDISAPGTPSTLGGDIVIAPTGTAAAGARLGSGLPAQKVQLRDPFADANAVKPSRLPWVANKRRVVTGPVAVMMNKPAGVPGKVQEQQMRRKSSGYPVSQQQQHQQQRRVVSGNVNGVTAGGARAGAGTKKPSILRVVNPELAYE